MHNAGHYAACLMAPDVLALVSPAQCRAARSILGWSSGLLAESLGTPVKAIRDFEAGIQHLLPYRVHRAMTLAFESAGLEFIRGGFEGVAVRPETDETVG